MKCHMNILHMLHLAPMASFKHYHSIYQRSIDVARDATLPFQRLHVLLHNINNRKEEVSLLSRHCGHLYFCSTAAAAQQLEGHCSRGVHITQHHITNKTAFKNHYHESKLASWYFLMRAGTPIQSHLSQPKPPFILM